MKNKNGTKDIDPFIIAENLYSQFQTYFMHDDGILPEFHNDHSFTNFFEQIEFTPQLVLKHVLYE